MASKCPAAGCTLGVRPGQLLCRGHWATTPGALRVAVNRTWREYRSLSNRAPVAKLTALKAYREARDAALAHHAFFAGAEQQGANF